MKNKNLNLAHQGHDIIQKAAYQALPEGILELMGLKTSEVREMLSVDLPVVEVRDSSTDMVYLFEDDTILHLEFQSTYDKNDLYRFAIYGLRLVQREKRKVRTAILYSANVKKVDLDLLYESINYKPDIIALKDHDGDQYLEEIEEKIKRGEKLKRVDVAKLAILPYSKTSSTNVDSVKRALQIANKIEDKRNKEIVEASIIVLANKILSETELEKLLEDFKMLYTTKKIKEERNIEIAKNLLNLGVDIEIISKSSGLTIEEIESLRN